MLSSGVRRHRLRRSRRPPTECGRIYIPLCPGLYSAPLSSLLRAFCRGLSMCHNNSLIRLTLCFRFWDFKQDRHVSNVGDVSIDSLVQSLQPWCKQVTLNTLDVTQTLLIICCSTLEMSELFFKNIAAYLYVWRHVYDSIGSLASHLLLLFRLSLVSDMHGFFAKTIYNDARTRSFAVRSL